MMGTVTAAPTTTFSAALMTLEPDCNVLAALRPNLALLKSASLVGVQMRDHATQSHAILSRISFPAIPLNRRLRRGRGFRFLPPVRELRSPAKIWWQ